MSPDQAMNAPALRALAEATRVSQVMDTDAPCVSMDTRIDAVVELFLDRDLAQAPVVDAAWRPLGVVTKNDLLRLFDGPATGALVLGGPVSAIALPQVVTVHHDASLSVAAAIMANEGVHVLPIVAHGGEIMGMISTLDLIRWLAKNTGMGGQEAGL